MAQFRPVRVATSTQLASLAKIEGQFIVVEGTQEIYFDKNSTTRILLGSNVDLSTLALTLTGTDLQLKDGDTVLSSIDMPVIANAVGWNSEVADIDEAAGKTTWTIV